MSCRRSVVCWLMLIIVMSWIALRSSFPQLLLSSVGIPKWVAPHVSSPLTYIDARLPAEILLIGSSLLLAPPYRLLAHDSVGDRMVAAGDRRFLSQCYEAAIENELGTRLNIVNVAIPGAVAEDQRIILDAVMNSEVKPKLVVYGLSPRDVIDNTMSKAPHENPVLRSFQLAKPHTRIGQVPVNELVDREVQFLKLMRKYIKDELSAYVSDKLGRPSSLWEAGQPHSPEQAERPLRKFTHSELVAADLIEYRSRYLPFRQDYFDFQLNSFRALLQVCNEHAVPIIVIRMPVAESNLALLPPGVLQSFVIGVGNACRKAGVEQIDLTGVDGNHYEAADFIDSVHLSKSGSAKFLKAFGGAMASSRTLHNAFSKLAESSRTPAKSR